MSFDKFIDILLK